MRARFAIVAAVAGTASNRRFSTTTLQPPAALHRFAGNRRRTSHEQKGMAFKGATGKITPARLSCGSLLLNPRAIRYGATHSHGANPPAGGRATPAARYAAPPPPDRFSA